jgi:4-hydroxybenzoate polyprenyltransferase
MVHFRAFFFILLFCGNYFLYSMPPLRLKRIPFFSKLFISLNSLILVLLGYATVCGSFTGFPKLLIAYFLVLFTAAINFIDIKDFEGDRENGIGTLPVLLGLKRAKVVIGMFVMVTYLALILIFKKPYVLVPLGILGSLQFALINRKQYSENLVFAVYLLSLILALTHIVFFKVAW